MSVGETMPPKKAADHPQNYYFTFGIGDHLFVVQPLGPQECQWKFRCPCGHGLYGLEKWTLWYPPGGLAQVRQDTSYRELTEPEMLRWFLKGGR